MGLWSSPRAPAEDAAVSGRLDPGTLPYQLQPVTPVARTAPNTAPAVSAQPQLHWLPHAPLRLLATPQALTAACTIVWPRPPPPVQAGEPIELLLRATDPWGNPVGSLGGATAVLERLADLDLQPLTLLQPRRAVLGAGTAAEDDADDLASRYIPCELHRGGFVRDGARDDDTYFEPESSARSIGWSELRLRAFPTRVGLYLPLLTVHGQPFRPPTIEYAMHVRAHHDAPSAMHARAHRDARSSPHRCALARPPRSARTRAARRCAAARSGSSADFGSLCAMRTATHCGAVQQRCGQPCDTCPTDKPPPPPPPPPPAGALWAPPAAQRLPRQTVATGRAPEQPTTPRRRAQPGSCPRRPRRTCRPAWVRSRAGKPCGTPRRRAP